MEVINRLYLSDCRRARRPAARRRLQAGLLLGVFLFVPAPVSGQATFSEARRFEEGVPVHALAVTDFDGDADADLVAGITGSDQTHALVWFENDGAGQFAAAQTLLADLPPALRTLAAADLDGDGDTDLLAGDTSTSGSGGLFWAANEGGGLGPLHVIVPVESGPFRAIDFDGDGDLDVLQGGLYVGLYENTGGSGGSRFRRVRALAPGPAETLAAADFDGDGDADLFASHRSYENVNDLLFYYEQRDPGQILFSARREFAGFSRGSDDYYRTVGAAEAADMDGDGDADLVVGEYRAYDVGPERGAVVWYRNQGLVQMPVVRPPHGIAYTSSARTAWGPVALAVADFNGDGDVDVAVSRYFHLEDSLSWYENPGDTPVGVPDAAWPLHEIASPGRSSITVLEAADLDGDEDPDLVTLEGRRQDRTIVWYENLVGTPTGTKLAETVPVPGSFEIASVWPNPSQGTLTVGYEAPAGEVQVVVFDVLGRRVASRTLQRAAAGKHEVVLDLGSLAAGAYVLRLEVDGTTATHRFVVAK